MKIYSYIHRNEPISHLIYRIKDTDYRFGWPGTVCPIFHLTNLLPTDSKQYEI